MLRKLLTENYEVDQAQVVQHIYRSLEDIQQKLQDEILHKQTIIESYTSEIKILRTQVDVKDQTLKTFENKLLESERNIEGNRQLINKLLNDLDRMQQDIEWYKRTYEQRSFFGVIKEKIFGKR